MNAAPGGCGQRGRPQAFNSPNGNRRGPNGPTGMRGPCGQRSVWRLPWGRGQHTRGQRQNPRRVQVVGLRRQEGEASPLNLVRRALAFVDTDPRASFVIPVHVGLLGRAHA